MSARFDDCTRFILAEECDYPWTTTGEYTNLKNDPGGPTKWGIDLRGERQTGGHPDWTASNIQSLSHDDAVAIYQAHYWDGHKCGDQPTNLDACFYNSWVNGGEPSKWIADCEGDWQKYLDLQEIYYRDIADEHPTLKQYLSDWLGRTARLKHFIITGDVLRP